MVGETLGIMGRLDIAIGKSPPPPPGVEESADRYSHYEVEMKPS